MRHINAERIQELMRIAPGRERIDAILKKTETLTRLTLEESALLLAVTDREIIERIFAAANAVKERIYGKRVVLFAPLYISSYCDNGCAYCAFRSGNLSLVRRALTPAEIQSEVRNLLSRGHMRLLMVAGEAAPTDEPIADFYCRSIAAAYAVRERGYAVKRVNINCAPLPTDDFRKLKAAGIGTYQLFQETYHDDTYRRVHPSGPKADADDRIDAIDRAFSAGIDDVGMGVLYGLADHRYDTLALLMHIEALEKKWGIGPHTISVPRMERADGSVLSRNVPHPVGDDDFRKIVAVLRLSVPYTGLILSTRETAAMRDSLFDLGISQVSAASRTAPGGYGDDDASSGQFSVSDHRTLDEMVASIIDHGYLPSFCAACYRTGRTGETFMDLARPGTIKDQCAVNALITLKEYCDDFASPSVKEKGYAVIGKAHASCDEPTRRSLARFFRSIDEGVRDEYV